MIGRDGTREEVIQKYERWFLKEPSLRREAKQELRGKNLVCWCAPEACHGDILLKYANQTNILLSGGAKGADTVFGNIAEAIGDEVIHFGFKDHNRGVVLSQEDLDLADSFLHRANKTLKRQYPTKNPFVDNLLKRNYYQIAETERVYAVAEMKNGKVQGGTAWAVQMFHDLGGKEIYILNIIDNNWYDYHGSSVNPPMPHGVYTGIGTRKMPENSELKLYEIYGII